MDIIQTCPGAASATCSTRSRLETCNACASQRKADMITAASNVFGRLGQCIEVALAAFILSTLLSSAHGQVFVQPWNFFMIQVVQHPRHPQAPLPRSVALVMVSFCGRAQPQPFPVVPGYKGKEPHHAASTLRQTPMVLGALPPPYPYRCNTGPHLQRA